MDRSGASATSMSSGKTQAEHDDGPIEFAAPFGPVGRLVEQLVLARYLRKLIEPRNHHLAGDPSHG